MKIGFLKRENKKPRGEEVIKEIIQNISHNKGLFISERKGPPNAYTRIENTPTPRHSRMKSQNNEDTVKMLHTSKKEEKFCPI